MLTQLHLSYFKNFESARLKLGRFTVLIGANAAGKSNTCEALRVLAGIGRGYSLVEVFGEKRGPGGDLVWSGIRGGMENAIYTGFANLVIEAEGLFSDDFDFQYEYSINIGTSKNLAIPIVREEGLVVDDVRVFHILPLEQAVNGNPTLPGEEFCLSVPWLENGLFAHARTKSALTELSPPDQDEDEDLEQLHYASTLLSEHLASTQFIDFSPDALRRPSAPGQTTLGSRGENLSSVLMELCSTPESKDAILNWLKALTPMDVVDLRFHKYSAGRIQLALVEQGENEVSADSASDGTLRFLGFLAQLMSAPENSIIVFEEIEIGIHPLRLHVLVDLIERTAARRNLQIVATTHSPQLLQYLSAESLETTSLVYREAGKQQASIIPILDIPNAREALQQTPISELAAGSWLEDAVFLSRSDEDVP